MLAWGKDRTTILLTSAVKIEFNFFKRQVSVQEWSKLPSHVVGTVPKMYAEWQYTYANWIAPDILNIGDWSAYCSESYL